MTKLQPDTEAMLEEAHDWMVLLEDPSTSEAERERFKQWIEADRRRAHVFDRAITFREAIKATPAASFADDLHQPSLRERLQAATDRALGLLAQKASLVSVAAAAVLVIALVLRPLFETLPEAPTTPVAMAQTLTTEIRQLSTGTLVDGTEFTLGPASAINVSYSAFAREVSLLRGEVFFSVAADPDRPFSVQAARLTATALGTAFEVRRSADTTRVAVAEGTVEVTHPTMAARRPTSLLITERLSAGNEVAATDDLGMGEPVAVSAENVGSWRQGRLVFRGASLAEILADVNRYSTVPVELDPQSPDLATRRLSGAFEGSELDALLQSIADIHSLSVDRSEPRRIVLRVR